MNVLVVEDEPDLALLIEIWLQTNRADISVCLRQSGSDVIDDDIRWADAALVDYHLPDIDGREVCHRIWEMDPSVRRVLWTAGVSPSEPCEWVDQTLTKPATLDQVRAALNGS